LGLGARLDALFLLLRVGSRSKKSYFYCWWKPKQEVTDVVQAIETAPDTIEAEQSDHAGDQRDFRPVLNKRSDAIAFLSLDDNSSITKLIR